MDLGSFNQQALRAPNQAAFSPNQAAYQSGNQAAYQSGNQAAYQSGNQAAYAPNQAAYSPNQAALPMFVPVGLAGVPVTMGAGNPSGHGFLGGYGPVARADYATPADLGPLDWAFDFSRGNGWSPYPLASRINPYDCAPPWQWQTQDWDPGLRFWTLPFDPQLTEWLQDLDLARPAVMAAREFARHHDWWLARETQPAPSGAGGGAAADRLQHMLDPDQHLGWLPRSLGGGAADAAAAWVRIDGELEELADLMQDDRWRYLAEAHTQSSNIGTYFMHLMGISAAAKPWTVELMNCASAIANLVKMQYKAAYRRVRPSALCPGLVPPWGPPSHPAFPSGHSMVAHLTALFLLSVPGIAQRFGLGEPSMATTGPRRPPALADFYGATSTRWGQDTGSPLLWLAWRVARTRERLGVHYPSDSRASRRLAAGVWAACLGDQAQRTWTPMGGPSGNGAGKAHGTGTPGPMAKTLAARDVPTLRAVLARATAEWPELTAKKPSTPPATKK